MSNVEFGIGLRRLDNVAVDAREAEALGYEYVCTGEHVFFHGPVGNGLIALAAAAGATERIRMMSTITLAPLYPAALLAKQVATLDQVSGGRFSLGVGVGGEYPKEFEACGVPVSERGARTDESLDILGRLCREENLRYEGRFNTLSGVTLAPKPVQQPHPPIWVSGRSEAAMRRCARFGTGWLPYMYTPEKLAGSMEQIKRFSASWERPAPVQPGLFIFFAVHEDREVASGWPWSGCHCSTTRTSRGWSASTPWQATRMTWWRGCASTSTPAPAPSCSIRLPGRLCG